MNGEKRKLAFVKGMKNEGKNMSKSISILDKDYPRILQQVVEELCNIPWGHHIV